MKKAIAIALITIALFGISQIPVSTTYEDGSTYQESLGSQLIYIYRSTISSHSVPSIKVLLNTQGREKFYLF